MKIPATANSAQITEIFSSLQGEGPYAGSKQIFVRFEECHMHCTFCDEIHKIGTEWSLEKTLAEIRRLEKEEGPHLYVSLTGGEPLLYLPFVKPLTRILKDEGFAVYLETSGVLWKALDEVIDDCAVIATDLKPPSVTHDKNYLEEHRRFLAMSFSRPFFLKMVVSKELKLEEYDAHLKMVAEIAPRTTLFLQPLTKEREGHEDPELMQFLRELQTRGQRWIKDIRIGLRLHRILSIR